MDRRLGNSGLRSAGRLVERCCFAVRLSVCATNAVHDGDGGVLGSSTLLAAVRKAMDLVVRVATVEERYGVALLAALIDDPVGVADVLVVGPDYVRRSFYKMLGALLTTS